jgi:hypothetical protein
MTEAPDYLNRVAGVRIWRVAPTLWAQLGGLLWAPAVKEPWPTGEEHVATCSGHPDHVPPAEGCSCGIYAFYDPQQAFAADYWPKEHEPFINLPFSRLVAGVVGVAGEIVLHDHGLLAARARVEAIFTDGAPDEDLPMPRQVIADAYDVPVIDSEDYHDFCAELGLIVFGAEDL